MKTSCMSLLTSPTSCCTKNHSDRWHLRHKLQRINTVFLSICLLSMGILAAGVTPALAGDGGTEPGVCMVDRYNGDRFVPGDMLNPPMPGAPKSSLGCTSNDVSLAIFDVITGNLDPHAVRPAAGLTMVFNISKEAVITDEVLPAGLQVCVFADEASPGKRAVVVISLAQGKTVMLIGTSKR